MAQEILITGNFEYFARQKFVLNRAGKVGPVWGTEGCMMCQSADVPPSPSEKIKIMSMEGLTNPIPSSVHINCFI